MNRSKILICVVVSLISIACNNELGSHENHNHEIVSCGKCNHGSGTGDCCAKEAKKSDFDVKKDSTSCSSE